MHHMLHNCLKFLKYLPRSFNSIVCMSPILGVPAPVFWKCSGHVPVWLIKDDAGYREIGNIVQNFSHTCNCNFLDTSPLFFICHVSELQQQFTLIWSLTLRKSGLEADEKSLNLSFMVWEPDLGHCGLFPVGYFVKLRLERSTDGVRRVTCLPVNTIHFMASP